VGTVESEHRTDHVRSICNRVGCDFCAPLWGVDPRELAETMIESGLEIVVVEVTAPGFDESWLGRRLDRDALAELEALRRDQGVHLLGRAESSRRSSPMGHTCPVHRLRVPPREW